MWWWFAPGIRLNDGREPWAIGCRTSLPYQWLTAATPASGSGPGPDCLNHASHGRAATTRPFFFARACADRDRASPVFALDRPQHDLGDHADEFYFVQLHKQHHERTHDLRITIECGDARQSLDPDCTRSIASSSLWPPWSKRKR